MKDVDLRVFTRMLQKDERTEGRTDGSVTISLRNFVGEGDNKFTVILEASVDTAFFMTQ